MMIFSEDLEIARLIPGMIASYSASLFEARKSKCMACSIISPVGALCCSPSPALSSVVKCHPHSESANGRCLVPLLVVEFMLKSQPVFAPLTPDEVYIEYRTHSTQSPTEPSALTDQAYV